MATKWTRSFQTSDEGSNELYIASHLTHFMPVQIKFWMGGWLRACPHSLRSPGLFGEFLFKALANLRRPCMSSRQRRRSGRRRLMDRASVWETRLLLDWPISQCHHHHQHLSCLLLIHHHLLRSSWLSQKVQQYSSSMSHSSFYTSVCEHLRLWLWSSQSFPFIIFSRAVLINGLWHSE